MIARKRRRAAEQENVKAENVKAERTADVQGGQPLEGTGDDGGRKEAIIGCYSPICATAVLTNTGSDPVFWRNPVTTSSVPRHNQRGAPHSG